ncbi:hypothetical protein BGZ94_000645, partial [Podila epigama]
MKFISQRLAAFAAIASILCLVSTPPVKGEASAVDAADPKAAADQPVALLKQKHFEALTHGKKHHHHHNRHHHHHGGKHHHGHRKHKRPHRPHRKHKKPHKKPHPNHHKKPHKPHKKPHKPHHHHKPKPKPPKPCPKPCNSTVLSLVCDGFIIDQLTCKHCKPRPALGFEEQKVTFDAANNGGKCPKPPKPNSVYIVMSTPCSKDLPKNCTAAKDGAVLGSEPDLPEAELGDDETWGQDDDQEDIDVQGADDDDEDEDEEDDAS